VLLLNEVRLYQGLAIASAIREKEDNSSYVIARAVNEMVSTARFSMVVIITYSGTSAFFTITHPQPVKGAYQ
jgi:pyruvate kinase